METPEGSARPRISKRTPAFTAFDWGMVTRSLARPYRVPVSMVLLFALVPFSALIPEFLPPRTRHVPELALDRALPLVPSWAIVYGARYLFLILLPICVVRQDELIRRTVYAYRLIWITAYVFVFVVYPTAAPRPDKESGEGFAVWGLRVLYSSDPPYTCLPSLHVAHSFVSALACSRVHRRLGIIAMIGATLVAFSTLFTKQHYVLDLVAGVFLAFVAYGRRGAPTRSLTPVGADGGGCGSRRRGRRWGPSRRRRRGRRRAARGGA